MLDLLGGAIGNVSLEFFVLIGTLIEEILSPIPSFFVLVPAGGIASAQNKALWYLLVLAIFSGFGRIIGGSILYFLANKSSSLLFKGRRKVFGITHKQITRFGKKLTGRPLRDWLILFFMNSFPLFPGAAISLVSGFFGVRFGMFVTSTFFGTIINALFFLSLGYGGFGAATLLGDLGFASQIFTIVVVAALIVWLVIKLPKTQ